MKRRRIQLVAASIPAYNTSISVKADLDQNYTHIVGIGASTLSPDTTIIENSKVSGQELLADDFEITMLKANNSVSPNDRFLDLHPMKSAGKSLELKLKDMEGVNGQYPKQLTFYVILEREEKDS